MHTNYMRDENLEIFELVKAPDKRFLCETLAIRKSWC